MQLLEAAQGSDRDKFLRRTWLEMEDGRKLALPFRVQHEEFLAEGNFVALGNDCFGLYDGRTETGAFYCGLGTPPYWLTWQPVSREVFFEDMAPSWYASARKLAIEGGREVA